MKVVKKILSNFLFWMGKVMPNLFKIIPEDDSFDVLRSAGYGFPALSFPCNDLNDNKLDFSFIVPVYNAKNSLIKCVNSLAHQDTNYNYEIILVDDGSTDGSKEIISELVARYPNLIRVHTQSNQGISASRNKGLEMALGRYVGFVDDDDYISLSYLDKCIKLAEETDADIVQTGFIDQDPLGRLIDKTVHTDAIIRNYTVDSKVFLSGYVWCGIYKKEMFKQIRFPQGFWYEDMITVMLLLAKSKLTAVLGEHLYFKTVHDNNASKVLWNSKNIKSVDRFWLAKSLVEYGRKYLDLKVNTVLFHSLVYELGPQLFASSIYKKRRVRIALFSLSSLYLISLGIRYNKIEGDKYIQQLASSFGSGNYTKWLLTNTAYFMK